MKEQVLETEESFISIEDSLKILTTSRETIRELIKKYGKTGNPKIKSEIETDINRILKNLEIRINNQVTISLKGKSKLEMDSIVRAIIQMIEQRIFMIAKETKKYNKEKFAINAPYFKKADENFKTIGAKNEYYAFERLNKLRNELKTSNEEDLTGNIRKNISKEDTVASGLYEAQIDRLLLNSNLKAKREFEWDNEKLLAKDYDIMKQAYNSAIRTLEKIQISMNSKEPQSIMPINTLSDEYYQQFLQVLAQDKELQVPDNIVQEIVRHELLEEKRNIAIEEILGIVRANTARTMVGAQSMKEYKTDLTTAKSIENDLIQNFHASKKQRKQQMLLAREMMKQYRIQHNISEPLEYARLRK